MPHVTMEFIEFHNWSGRTLDLLLGFPKRYHPLTNCHMSKPQDPVNPPKAKAF